MAEFFLEVLSEEIPARMQAPAAENLRDRILSGLQKYGLAVEPGAVHTLYGPRRLSLHIPDLPPLRPEKREEKRGPREGAPESAIQGFLKSVGLQSLEECERRDTGKGVFWFAHLVTPGGPTADILSDVIIQALLEFPWPKSMRFGNQSFRWIRPLHSILAVFDGLLVTGQLPLGEGKELPFGTGTEGHRFLASGPIAVTRFEEYARALRAAKVLLDAEERKSVLLNFAETLKHQGLHAYAPASLWDEIAGLTEWPVPLLARIDAEFLYLPQEVLTSVMFGHQRYIALKTVSNELADRFIAVANIETKDAGKAIIAGNERVLRARFQDAKFYWDLDRKQTLESRLPKLCEMVFHAKLGSQRDRADRLSQLAAGLAAWIPGADAQLASRAGLLAKADLVSGMVGEFPELQGVMGRYYARLEGEPEAVAEAIADQYRPNGAEDMVPSLPLSLALALADRLDLLTGFFAIGETPTGSKDPYGLRRAALGVIRIILENTVNLPLRQLLKRSYELYTTQQAAIRTHSEAAVIDAILDFFADRLKVVLRDQAIRHDLIAAVFAVSGEDDLLRLKGRAEALQQLLQSPAGSNLLTGANRASNILKIEERKEQRTYAGDPDPALFQLPEETAFFAGVSKTADEIQPLLNQGAYIAAMDQLAKLRPVIDTFFDRVTVNSGDAALRINRLRLLSLLRDMLRQVADFSKIEG